MTQASEWRVLGTYFEACNCEAICPCRKQGGMKRTNGSTYGVCDFAMSWCIVKGTFADVDLSDRLDFDLRGRCGFESHFDYSSQAGA